MNKINGEGGNGGYKDILKYYKVGVEAKESKTGFGRHVLDHRGPKRVLDSDG